MTTRNVQKSLIGMEDFQQGVGQTSQTRADAPFDICKVDQPYAVNSIAEMSALDVARFTRARVYSSTTVSIDYIYDETDLTGEPSDNGTGTWIAVKRSEAYYFKTVADAVGTAEGISITTSGNPVTLSDGDVITIRERGDKYFDVIAGIATVNGFNRIESGDSQLTYVARNTLVSASPTVETEIDLVHWGAKGDNSTDNTTVLQLALDTAATEGSAIFVPQGTYLMTSTQTTISASIHIRGVSKENTIFKKSTNAATNMFQFENGTAKCSIKHLTLDGDFTTHLEGGQGFVLVDCSNWVIDDLTITDVKNSAILTYIDTGISDNVLINNVEIQGKQNTKNGIVIVDATNSGMRNCYVNEITEFGLELKNACRDSFIEDSVARHCELSAIVFGQTSGTAPSNSRVSNCQVLRSNGGLSLSNCNNNTLGTFIWISPMLLV